MQGLLIFRAFMEDELSSIGLINDFFSQEKTGLVTILDPVGKPRTAKLILTTDTLSVFREEIVSTDSNGNDQMLSQVTSHEQFIQMKITGLFGFIIFALAVFSQY